MGELHVVFGSGQIGFGLAERLLGDGMRVRVVKRTHTHLPPGCEIELGDAMDPAFCARAASGATTIYHCMNPAYDTKVWAEAVPRCMDNLIAAAAATKARLVVLDNLYMLGAPRGKKLNEDTPMNPSSRKGEIRAQAEQKLFDAHRRGDAIVTSARASDFYGPGATLTGLGDFFWPRALAGKTVYTPIPVDAVHTYHYIPDVVAGLATLGRADGSVFGQPWMLPCAPAQTMRTAVDRMATIMNRPLKVVSMPRMMVKAMGLFVPVMREIDEMLYQWDEPFVVDDSRFRARFGAMPTDVEQAARDTVQWATAHYKET